MFCCASSDAQELGDFPHLFPIEEKPQFYRFQRREYTGVCTRDGKVLIPAQYSELYYIGSDRFLTVDYDTGARRRLLFRSDGKKIFEFPDWFAYQNQKFEDGILAIQSPGQNGVAYIDVHGKYIVKPGKYDSGQPFSGGFAAVEYREKGQCKCGYIDKRGTLRLGPFDESWCQSFNNGRAAVRSYQLGASNNTSGLINRHGVFELPQIYSELHFLNDTELIAKENNCQKQYKITLVSGGKPIVEPYESSQDAVRFLQPRPRPLSIDRAGFESLTNIFGDPKKAHSWSGFYDPARRVEAFNYLNKSFGFLGMSKRELEKKLGIGLECLPRKWAPLPNPDSRYSLQYSLIPFARCGNAVAGQINSVFFSIDGNGHVDGWKLQGGAQHENCWHTNLSN